MAITCARCGRVQGHEELTWQGSALASMPEHADVDGRVLLEGNAWARIADQDICPDCLTAEEEQELARSYIDLLEAEVRRSQAAGTDPTPHEAALISYALVLRSRLASTDERKPTPPPPPPPPPRVMRGVEVARMAAIRGGPDRRFLDRPALAGEDLRLQPVAA